MRISYEEERLLRLLCWWMVFVGAILIAFALFLTFFPPSDAINYLLPWIFR